MRARSTWQSNKSETPRQAATSRKSDVYTMNQDHPQPSPTEYESGNPDSWAETPVPAEKMSVKDEYNGDAVKRNDVGFGEFRDDTWKHKDSDQWGGKGKYDNAKVSAERKAMACERLARATLRTSNTNLIEGAATDFMALPNKSIIAMLKRLDSVSPNALSEQSKFKRALACTKLAARLLGNGANAKNVEKLGSVMMSIDDPTLKAIVQTVAASRVAQEEEQEEQQEEQEGKTSQEQEQEEQEGKTSQEQEEEAEEAEEITSQQEQEAHDLSPEEMQMLQSMLGDQCAPGAAAPAAPGAAAPADDLSALFSAAPGGAPGAGSDISFSDDDDESGMPVLSSDLDDLFADDPEVHAQREIQSSQLEARNRESGFTGHVASTKNGAKKLGSVQKAAKPSVDQVLENLWERP